MKPIQTAIPHKIHTHTQTLDITRRETDTNSYTTQNTHTYTNARHKNNVKPTQTAIPHKIHTHTHTQDIERT